MRLAPHAASALAVSCAAPALNQDISRESVIVKLSLSSACSNQPSRPERVRHSCLRIASRRWPRRTLARSSFASIAGGSALLLGLGGLGCDMDDDAVLPDY